MSETPNAEALLDGHRVLDLTEQGFLLCGKVLGDLGADVIKIEPPGGSPSRNMGPFYHDIQDPEKSLFWFAYNTSKRGITLNLEAPSGKKIFKQLAKTADIILESFPPGYLDDLGLGYSGLSAIRSDIIMTSMTPFGQTGPYAELKATDMVAWAMGGMMGLCGDRDRPPLQESHPQATYHAGMQGAVGTMVALYHREMSGEGQHVDVSMQQAVVLTLMNGVEIGDLLGISPERPRPDGAASRPRAEEHGQVAFGVRWQCKDGYITWQQGLAGGAQPGMVRSTSELVRWMAEEGMAGDLTQYDWSEFDTSTVSQELVDHQGALFRAFFLAKTKQEILQRAAAKGILLGAFQTTRDIVQCPQLAAREYFTQVAHPELGDAITYPGAWAKTGRAPWAISRRAPLIGEHNLEILEGELKISEDELMLLQSQGVI